MPILKSFALETGAQVAYHRVSRVQWSDRPGAACNIVVNSWPSQALHDAGTDPLSALPLFIALAPSAGNLFSLAEAALVASDGPWQGGSLAAVVVSTPLAQAKDRHWAALKLKRDMVERAGFAWDGSTFDSDSSSQSKIQGGAQLATLAMIASQSFSIDWTLADNAVRTLSGANMLAVGQALGVHIMSVHATGRTLRTAIEAAADTAALEAVVWPA